MHQQTIIDAIEQSPLNRGLLGSEWLSDQRNIPFVVGDDVILFDYEGSGTYQIHLLLSSRGRPAIDRIRQASDFMFREHGAQLLFGLIPKDRRHVKLIGRLAGWKYVEDRDTEDGVCELYVLNRKGH